MKKGIICTFLSIVVCLLVICAAFGYTKYEEYNLETAYNNGYLTQDDLKSIAYYYNKETILPDFKLIPKAKLSPYVERSIKMSYLQRPSFKKDFPFATVKDIGVFDYYGTYNGYVVVKILDSLARYDLIYEPEKMIGGVTFYDYNHLIKVFDVGDQR